MLARADSIHTGKGAEVTHGLATVFFDRGESSRRKLLPGETEQ